jgi:hypothetical protein
MGAATAYVLALVVGVLAILYVKFHDRRIS